MIKPCPDLIVISRFSACQSDESSRGMIESAPLRWYDPSRGQTTGCKTVICQPPRASGDPFSTIGQAASEISAAKNQCRRSETAGGMDLEDFRVRDEKQQGNGYAERQYLPQALRDRDPDLPVQHPAAAV